MEELSQFWNIKNINFVDTYVKHQFEKDMYHERERYATKLLFKPDNDVLPDNSRVCEKRLRNFKKKLVNEKLFDD